MSIKNPALPEDVRAIDTGGKTGDYQLPTDPNKPVAQAYTTINQNVWKDGATKEEHQAAHNAEVLKQKAAVTENPTLGKAYTADELWANYGHLVEGNLASSLGGYTTDYATVLDAANRLGAEWSEAIMPGTGDAGYQYDRTRANSSDAVAQGTSGADEALLSDLGYNAIQLEKQNYATAKAGYDAAIAAGDTALAAQYKAQMDKAHENAERIRLSAGYQGGVDGSQYLTAGELGLANDSSGASTSGLKNGVPVELYASTSANSGTTGNTYSGVTIPQSNIDVAALQEQWKNSIPDVDAKKADQLALLEEWKATLLEQSNNQIDYNVAKAITELERALEDAQPQYKEQMESVAKDEMQALDNSALYAEMRGDKGGIGQSQYNEIQAAAAQNRLSVQQAQTKLSTDTARQIADLRAQGEFEKADKALEISQQYLSQLISLEQWATEYGLTAAQFQASLDQWAAEYDMAMQQFEVSVDQWNQEFAFAQQQHQDSLNQWEQEFALTQQQYQSSLNQWAQEFQADTDKWNQQLALSEKESAASLAQSLLNMGISLTEEQMAALGIDSTQAAEWAKLGQAAQTSSSSSGGGGGDAPAGVWDTIKYMANQAEVERYLLEADLTAGEREGWLNQWLNAQPSDEPVNPVEGDGVVTENTLAWAKKVLAAQGNVDGLVLAMENRGFSEADIVAILRELGFQVALN